MIVGPYHPGPWNETLRLLPVGAVLQHVGDWPDDSDASHKNWRCEFAVKKWRQHDPTLVGTGQTPESAVEMFMDKWRTKHA